MIKDDSFHTCTKLQTHQSISKLYQVSEKNTLLYIPCIVSWLFVLTHHQSDLKQIGLAQIGPGILVSENGVLFWEEKPWVTAWISRSTHGYSESFAFPLPRTSGAKYLIINIKVIIMIRVSTPLAFSTKTCPLNSIFQNMNSPFIGGYLMSEIDLNVPFNYFEITGA